MTFGTFTAILVLMLIAYFMLAALKGISPVTIYEPFGDEETTLTTTTTTEEPATPNIVGNLKRQIEGIQSFVVDPVDSQKIWLNSNDDLYEDADGKIWRLV